MTAPAKPWEAARIPAASPVMQQQQQQHIFNDLQYSRSRPPVNNPIMVNGTTNLSGSTIPRPPPRPGSTAAMSRTAGYRAGYGANTGTTAGYGGYSGYNPMSSMRGYGGYNSYGGGYGGYSSYGSPYSSYGMMGSYGQMPYGQNPYGHHGLESRFIQAAEESSRPAFESLESLVHAFGSVSMMLESTFFAIHSSFRAVLGVAENFGRMRGLLAQVFSALTIFRATRWAAIRLLQLLRLRKPGEADQVWAEALGGSAEGDGRSSAWPIVMFMSLVIGGPYLIWKLIRSVQASLAETANNTNTSQPAAAHPEEPWMLGRAPCYLSQALFSFEARQADELSFSAGDVLTMAPAQQQTMKTQGWMLATRLRDASGAQVQRPSHVGLVPLNHFKTLYTRKEKRADDLATAGFTVEDEPLTQLAPQNPVFPPLSAPSVTTPVASAFVQQPGPPPQISTTPVVSMPIPPQVSSSVLPQVSEPITPVVNSPVTPAEVALPVISEVPENSVDQQASNQVPQNQENL